MKQLALLILLLPLLGSCTVVQPLQIEPQHKSTPIAPHFTQSYYYYDSDQNLYFVMQSIAPDAAGKPVEQIATIRVFWRPRGGVTTLNGTALNATFRYMILAPDAIGMYEGAGFVRLNSATGAGTMSARVVDADMRLTQASANFVDTLGRSHIHGALSATYDDAKTTAMLLDAQRQFFARSLASKPATNPADTAPATTSQPVTTIPGTQP